MWVKPLDEQLEMGIRQFELDIHYNFGRGLKVYHAPVVDPYTTCEYLSECLTLIKDWSDKNFNHHVIFIFFEPKDDFDLKTDKLTGGRWAEIEQEILDIFPRERIFTPDDLTKGGSFATLRDAYAANGWPTLGETRGKVMFILFDSGPVRNEYVEGNPTLKGRVMFARGGADTPYGLFRNIDDPTDEENFKAIQDAVLNGFLIRTRADAECIEAYKKDFTRQQKALECGAQMISTDFPEPPEWSEYFFDIKTGTPSVCNPVTAPGGCSPKDIENLGNK
jgi:hypothetical protein